MIFTRPAFSRAFTTVEILVVCAIGAVLIAIAWPALQTALARSKNATCVSHLSQLGTALNLYLADHEMIMPQMVALRESVTDDLPTLDTVLLPYVSDKNAFACPADKKLSEKSGTSYFWNSILNGQSVTELNILFVLQSSVDGLSNIPVMSDKEGWHTHNPEKVNILYADGHTTQGLQFNYQH